MIYPDLPGIEHIHIPKRPKKNMLLMPYIKRAIASGEFPRNADPEFIGDILQSLFVGALLALYDEDPNQVRPTYRHMLQLLLKGLRVELSENACCVADGNVGF